jgi:hypothetical protein
MSILGNVKHLAVVTLGLVVFCGIASGGVVVTYPFTSDTVASYTGAMVQSTSFDSSNLSAMTAIGNDGFGTVLEAYPASGATDYATAVANDSYFTIDVVASAGNDLDLGSLEFEVGKGGSADPRGYFIRSSVDNYATDLYGPTVLGPAEGQDAPLLQTVDLSAIPSYQELTSITFRFYVYTPSSENFSVDFRNLELSEVAAVPEPSSLSLFLGLTLAWGGFSRRRSRLA